MKIMKCICVQVWAFFIDYNKGPFLIILKCNLGEEREKSLPGMCSTS